MYAAMCQQQLVNIRQVSQSRAAQVGHHRFLENEAVSISELVRSLARHCEQQVEGQPVLAISDTRAYFIGWLGFVSLNLTYDKTRVSGV